MIIVACDQDDFPPLEHGVVVNRTAETVIRLLPQLVITEAEADEALGRLDAALGKAPRNYRKLVRLGVFGATIPYFLCEITIRGTDLSGKTVIAPWFNSHEQRCEEPEPEPGRH